MLAGTLAGRLAELQSNASAGRNGWGRGLNSALDVFRAGMPEDLTETDRSGLRLDLPGLLRGHIGALRRQAATRRYSRGRWSGGACRMRCAGSARLMGQMPDWTELSRFLPEVSPVEPLARRAAIASTLLAGLEMARGGAIDLRQEESFGPIMIRRGPGSPGAAEAGADAGAAAGGGLVGTCSAAASRAAAFCARESSVRPKCADRFRRRLLHIADHGRQRRAPHSDIGEVRVAGCFGDLQTHAERIVECGRDCGAMALVEIELEHRAELQHGDRRAGGKQCGGSGRGRIHERWIGPF